MRDFPIFTTEYGVSTLTLREIPYKKTAYIYVRDVQEAFFREHLAECIGFCRMCGADYIFASGHEKLEEYPLYTTVLEMRGNSRPDHAQMKCLFPVTEETVSRWRSVYNKRMAGVDNASTLESRDEKRILQSGGAYFIHENGHLLGIGWMDGTKLLAVASVENGTGEQLMHTLMSLTEGQTMTLEVASTNTRAIRLYEKLGFFKTAEIVSWYQCLP